RLGSASRSALDRVSDQAWIGLPISVRSGVRSGLDRPPDQAWTPISLTPTLGLAIATSDTTSLTLTKVSASPPHGGECLPGIGERVSARTQLSGGKAYRWLSSFLDV
ncbi:MAG: hypothetical protein LBK00_01545, partial [Treponema sp.]|nr:hypothetical protein [Treponema sp.]